MDSPKHQTQAIALLGRRDEPTDAVEDYCQLLAGGLAKSGWTLETLRVPWSQQGWRKALAWLSWEAKPWRGRWVLVQYTALAWSRNGFPVGLLAVLWILRLRGARCVVIFHDMPYPGDRLVDRLRRAFQARLMRVAYRGSEHSIQTLPLDKVPWLPSPHSKAAFIPVGANIFSLDDLAQEGILPAQQSPGTGAPTLGVFGVSTWPSAQREEIEAIVHVARAASSRMGEVRLLILGRGAQEAEAALHDGLSGSQVVLTVYGVLESREVSVRLIACDVFLFARGAFSTRRSSGLAAIACGLPIVAYEVEETGFPLSEGGILFVPYRDLASLANQVTRVLQDSHLRDSLRVRNRALFQEWFSWDRIAQRLIALLNGVSGKPQADSNFRGMQKPTGRGN